MAAARQERTFWPYLPRARPLCVSVYVPHYICDLRSSHLSTLPQPPCTHDTHHTHTPHRAVVSQSFSPTTHSSLQLHADSADSHHSGDMDAFAGPRKHVWQGYYPDQGELPLISNSGSESLLGVDQVTPTLRKQPSLVGFSLYSAGSLTPHNSPPMGTRFLHFNASSPALHQSASMRALPASFDSVCSRPFAQPAPAVVSSRQLPSPTSRPGAERQESASTRLQMSTHDALGRALSISAVRTIDIRDENGVPLRGKLSRLRRATVSLLVRQSPYPGPDDKLDGTQAGRDARALHAATPSFDSRSGTEAHGYVVFRPWQELKKARRALARNLRNNVPQAILKPQAQRYWHRRQELSSVQGSLCSLSLSQELAVYARSRNGRRACSQVG